MRAALLILTALTTGLQLLSGLVMVICGSAGLDLSILKIFPLAGSVILFIAACMPAAKALTTKLTLAGCAILWLWYLPGLFSYVSNMISGRDYFDWILFVPSILLTGSTVYAVCALKEQPVKQ